MVAMSNNDTTKPLTSPKKRKHTVIDVDSPVQPKKKSKKEKHAAGDVKPQRRKAKSSVVAPRPSEEASSEFASVQCSMVVSIPPVFASDPFGGVEEMLDSMLMRYMPALQGVVLAHDALHFLHSSARISGDSPYAVCPVQFDATVWSPRIGMKIKGRINLSSPDHVSLLVHRTFNVSIPRHHIPTDFWHFEYGAAENDPEFGPASTDADEGGREDAETGVVADMGKWVHSITGEELGGKERTLEFTVIGLTVANQMLSLTGSLQSDPFSSDHVPEPAQPKAIVPASPPGGDSDEEEIQEIPQDMYEEDEDMEREAEAVAKIKAEEALIHERPPQAVASPKRETAEVKEKAAKKVKPQKVKKGSAKPTKGRTPWYESI